ADEGNNLVFKGHANLSPCGKTPTTCILPVRSTSRFHFGFRRQKQFAAGSRVRAGPCQYSPASASDRPPAGAACQSALFCPVSPRQFQSPPASSFPYPNQC